MLVPACSRRTPSKPGAACGGGHLGCVNCPPRPDRKVLRDLPYVEAERADGTGEERPQDILEVVMPRNNRNEGVHRLESRASEGAESLEALLLLHRAEARRVDN